jgi:penicillin amidase
MDVDRTRRALIATIVGGGAAASTISPIRGYLERFAPLSGSAWQSATAERERVVESPYGAATVRYDDYGVPHVEADAEAALAFATGYVQATDRLFQMDLSRRLMRGQLAAVVGSAALDSDEFHVRMEFTKAAEASWELLDGTDAGRAISAYAEGVNRAMATEALPLECALLEYEPDPWTPVDTMLAEKQISWELTGNFRTLRHALVADRLGLEVVDELFPARLDHEVPILRPGPEPPSGNAGGERSTSSTPNASEGNSASTATRSEAIGPELLDWLGDFESGPGIGSNSWVVGSEHTGADAGPIVANDPHLGLSAPPVWYEMDLRTRDMDAHGVTFPGIPFVIIGANDAGAWGFTNVGADVIDFYSYEIDDAGERYRYRGEWRPFETEEREIEVANGENREITTRRTVHGPLLEREDQRVGVTWTGHAATATSLAIRAYNRSTGIDDVLEATERFDLPTQNLVYADRDGNTLYYVTGKLPIRRVDGERVNGDRIFDGSAGEGEWQGFTPFGTSSWEGFVPFEAKPHATNPEYLATANQRVANDPEYYIAEAYADPYRAQRIYDLLDARARSEEPIDMEFVRRVQRDTVDLRAASMVPTLLEVLESAAIGETGPESPEEPDLEPYVEALREWDYSMDRDALGALVFAFWLDAYREAVLEPVFASANLDSDYYPSDWVVEHLEPESRWFEGSSRAALMTDALREAVREIEAQGWETYGEYNSTGAIAHPLGLDFLGYPDYPTDGSEATVRNYDVLDSTGSSWRMVVDPTADDTAACAFPGGNSGSYFSESYSDRLRSWANGEYVPLYREPGDGPSIRFAASGSLESSESTDPPGPSESLESGSEARADR